MIEEHNLPRELHDPPRLEDFMAFQIAQLQLQNRLLKDALRETKTQLLKGNVYGALNTINFTLDDYST